MVKRTAFIGPVAPSLAPLGAGVMIGLSIITPVFAATGDGFADWHIVLMVGSLILLVVGVILKARQTRRGPVDARHRCRARYAAQPACGPRGRPSHAFRRDAATPVSTRGIIAVY